MLKFLKKLLRKVTLDYVAKKVQKELSKDAAERAKEYLKDPDFDEKSKAVLLKYSKEALEQYNENRRGKD